ncbi:hypothetical protein CCA_00405 [Chlamydia caviae GPIC]|uniref:Uncharacterized protein n=1 Tax=Chlamydia caviae (strain ATCC VR-813 / DSM 19441 / 03DC25 / GPIC) TaxID=227941 RepID=Q823K5_CHLCV|nr:hypothetical protein CCA_00405 [Chlamydia caviae GPIC]
MVLSNIPVGLHLVNVLLFLGERKSVLFQIVKRPLNFLGICIYGQKMYSIIL